MSRTASGTVEWRGNPARWWARVTARAEDRSIRRPWVDLERPDLKDTREDKKTASGSHSSARRSRSKPSS
jgi:hypothetical protein